MPFLRRIFFQEHLFSSATRLLIRPGSLLRNYFSHDAFRQSICPSNQFKIARAPRPSGRFLLPTQRTVVDGRRLLNNGATIELLLANESIPRPYSAHRLLAMNLASMTDLEFKRLGTPVKISS